MDEKLEKKLKKLLSKAGIDETKIEEVIADLKDDSDETTVEAEVEESTSEVPNDAPVEDTPAEPETPVENTTPEEAPVEEVEGEVAPLSDDAPETVEPTALPEETEQPLPPVEEVAPEIAPQTSELENKVAELEKALEGLKAHNDSLVEALKKAGILEETVETSVGVDESSTPSNESEVEGSLDDTLAKLNRNSF